NQLYSIIQSLRRCELGVDFQQFADRLSLEIVAIQRIGRFLHLLPTEDTVVIILDSSLSNPKLKLWVVCNRHALIHCRGKRPPLIRLSKASTIGCHQFFDVIPRSAAYEISNQSTVGNPTLIYWSRSIFHDTPIGTLIVKSQL